MTSQTCYVGVVWYHDVIVTCLLQVLAALKDKVDGVLHVLHEFGVFVEGALRQVFVFRNLQTFHLRRPLLEREKHLQKEQHDVTKTVLKRSKCW